MAMILARGTSFSVRWRAGRAGRTQHCTFPGPSRQKALAAKHLAEAHQHRITSAEVYLAVDPDRLQRARHTRAPLLRDWIERWLALKVDVAAGTHAEYARLLRRSVIPELGDIRVCDLSRLLHLDPWKAELSQRVKPATTRKTWAVLHQVMRDATPLYRADNPLARPAGHRTNGLPRLDRSRACFLEPAEAAILLQHCPPQIHDLAQVALGTGMRLGELLGLQAGAIDIRSQRPKIYVEQTLLRDGTFGEPKSAASRRAILLPASTAALTARLVADLTAEDLVFTAPDGGPWDSHNFRRRYWQPAVQAAQTCPQHPQPRRAGTARRQPARPACRCPGIVRRNVRFQDLRHTHVATLIEAGWDFYAIQLRIGHASIKTTFDVYGHRLAHGDLTRLHALDSLLPCGNPAAADLP